MRRGGCWHNEGYEDLFRWWDFPFEVMKGPMAASFWMGHVYKCNAGAGDGIACVFHLNGGGIQLRKLPKFSLLRGGSLLIRGRRGQQLLPFAYWGA